MKLKYTCTGWRCPVCEKIVTLTETDEAPHYCYKCPECGSVTGADEWNNDELIIAEFAKKQICGHFACPRCGRMSMDPESATRNALSRRADVYICDRCGMQEALEDIADSITPLKAWAIIENTELWRV